MKINPPGFNTGTFVTTYIGQNYKIRNSPFRLTSQRIIFNKSLKINGNITEKCCFEMTILSRKFLMVLDDNRVDDDRLEDELLYEIVEDEGEKIFILLKNSRMYVKNHFICNKKYIIQGTLYLRYSYTEYAEFDEEFEFQLELLNHKCILELFENINV